MHFLFSQSQVRRLIGNVGFLPTVLTEFSNGNNLMSENKEAPRMNVGIGVKNIGKGETILRIVLGLVCIGLAFVFSGLLAWVVGLVGVTLLLTAFFGY